MRFFHSLILPAALLVLAAPLSAAPHLVADLNRGPSTQAQVVDLNPGGASGSPILYFLASDPAHGKELWRSDGTARGTWRLTDVCPGRCDSNPEMVKVFQGHLFFIAGDGVSGRELWVTDGLPGSERRLRDVCPGPCDTEFGGFQILGDRLLFTTIAAGEHTLWRTDGTSGGTVALQTLPDDNNFLDGFVQRLGGDLYFNVFRDGDVAEIWRTDGTAAGTLPLSALVSGLPPGASLLQTAGSAVLFTTQDSLWRTDGTVAGTWSLSARVPGLPLPVSDLTPIGDGATSLFWSREALWRTDGTAAGTERVKQVADLVTVPPGVDIFPYPVAVWRGSLYSFVGQTLVRTDGTAAGTTVVHRFNPDDQLDEVLYEAVPMTKGLLLVFGPLYRTARALWQTQGTPETTERITRSGGGISEIATLNGRALFFVSSDLWTSDGTGGGTHRAVSIPDPYPGGLAVAGRQAFFLAGEHSQNLWRTDGTAAGTRRVRGFTEGPAGSGPLAQGVLGDKLVFSAQTGRFEAPLFVSDGTAAGTSLLSRDVSWAASFIPAGSRLFLRSAQGLGVTDGNAQNPAGTRVVAQHIPGFQVSGILGNLLLFGAGTGPSVYYKLDVEPWRSDGTEAGTFLLGNLDPFLISTGVHATCVGESSRPGPGVEVQGRLLFAATDGDHGRELWSTDGTLAGSRLVRDINPARGPIEPDRDDCNDRTDEGLSSNPTGFVAFQGGALFAADDGDAGGTGRELWWSDGTAEGTRLVKDLLPGPEGSKPRELILFQGAAYFFASNPGGGAGNGGDAGDTLWRTDGTESGTVLVGDLTVGGKPSWARNLTVAGDHLFFSVYNEATGAELWASQGTAVSTSLVTDLRPGAAGSYPQHLTAAGNVLVFAATDGVHGLEPWRSDGTAAGTRPLGDIRPGPDASSPGPFSVVGKNILFGADDGVHGRELWAIPLSEVAVALRW